MCILILIDSCLKMIWRGLNINNRIQDPTGFENSDRNQENEESEEISCETDLVSNYENLEGIVRI